MVTRAERKLRKMRKAALGASKGLVTAGKLASAAGATGVGKKLQAGGRAEQAWGLLEQTLPGAVGADPAAVVTAVNST